VERCLHHDDDDDDDDDDDEIIEPATRVVATSSHKIQTNRQSIDRMLTFASWYLRSYSVGSRERNQIRTF